MPNLGGMEIVLILVVLLLLFGATRLPGLARGLGQSLRIFKAETKGLRDDDTAPQQPRAGQPAPREIDGPRDVTPTRPLSETERTDRPER